MLRLPHLLRWYGNVQEVPGVLRAAEACGMVFSKPLACLIGPPVSPTEDNPASLLEEDEGQETVTQPPFVGGPRPTMTKLKVNDSLFSFVSHALHLCEHTHAGSKFPNLSFVGPQLVVNGYPCNFIHSCFC